MNKKAFTLAETIAVITILGILLLVAVPSISNLRKTTEKKRILEDAKLFIALAKEKIQSDTNFESSTIVINLDDIDKNRFNSPSYTVGRVTGVNCSWKQSTSQFACASYSANLENSDYKVTGTETNLIVTKK